MSINGLNVRIIDGPVDLDVTEHVTAISDMTRTAPGGFGQSVQIALDLPRWTFPTLGEQSRVIITDDTTEVVWEGFASDPGPVAGENGEAFEVLALGSMVLASDRVEPLVYLDTEPGSWVPVEGAVKSAQMDSIDGGFRLAHPQGQPITTGAFAGAEWRLLEHAGQDVAEVRFTTKSGLGAGNYSLVVFSVNAAGVATAEAFWGASTALQNRSVTLPAGTRAVQVRWVRAAGGATNVTDDLAWIEIGTPLVIGARVDQHGVLVAPDFPLTSTDIVADLIGRGMLAGIDADAATLEATTASHYSLSYADGARGSTILADLRKTDPEMLWAYGAKGVGGYGFSWRKWPTAGHRYAFSDLDEISLTGGSDERCHRVAVYYTDATTKRVKHVTVTVDLPRTTRTRDADPITLEIATEAEAIQVGRDALVSLAGKPPSGTVTVNRKVFDTATSTFVEPWEIQPGELAMIESTGEVLRIMSTSVDVDEGGAACAVKVGDPDQTLEDRLLGLLRGEIDPNRSLIGAPHGPVVPPVPNSGAPTHALKQEMDAVVAEIAGDFADVYTTIATGDSANAQAIDDAVDDFTAGLATKSKHTLSPSAPGVSVNSVGDVWEQHRAGDATKIIARFRGQGGTSWLPMNLDATYIPQLDIGTGTFGDLAGARVVAKSLGVEKLMVGSMDNLLNDPTFRLPLGQAWGTFSGGETVNIGRNGRSLRIVNTAAQQGGYNTAMELPTETGHAYRVFVSLTQDYAAVPASGVWVGIRWKISSGGVVWGDVYCPALPTGVWTSFSGMVTAPLNAVAMSVYIASMPSNPTGTLYIDYVSLTRANAGELTVDGTIRGRHLAADSITGLLVTGAAIQTHDDGTPPWPWARGVKISNSGIAGYPASGASTASFAFDTATGRAHLTGGISTGTGYDDITITPGSSSTPSAMEFWTNGAYYDNSNGNRAGLLCFDYTSGSNHEVLVRLHGPKMTTRTVRSRIDMVTKRTSDTGVEADIWYHAGSDPQGDNKGRHFFIIDGTAAVTVDRRGITMPWNASIGVGAVASTVPAGGITTSGPIKSSTRIDCDNGFYDQSVAIGGNGAWKGTAATWNTSGRLVGNTSSQRFKENIEPLALAEARKALDLEPVTFTYIPEAERGPGRFPGFLAEQADEAGMDLWINYDTEGRPTSFLYAELVAAHNAILRDHDTTLAALLARIDTLEATHA